jgi:hypothetical protein
MICWEIFLALFVLASRYPVNILCLVLGCFFYQQLLISLGGGV